MRRGTEAPRSLWTSPGAGPAAPLEERRTIARRHGCPGGRVACRYETTAARCGAAPIERTPMLRRALPSALVATACLGLAACGGSPSLADCQDQAYFDANTE